MNNPTMLQALKEARQGLNLLLGKAYTHTSEALTCGICHRTWPIVVHEDRTAGSRVEHDPDKVCGIAHKALDTADEAITEAQGVSAALPSGESCAPAARLAALEEACRATCDLCAGKNKDIDPQAQFSVAIGHYHVFTATAPRRPGGYAEACKAGTIREIIRADAAEGQEANIGAGIS